jgi:hypothetical protein
LAAQKAIEAFDAQAAKYRAESPRLAREPQGFSDQYEALNVHDDQFDAAEASLATAISVAAVAALTESWLALATSWLFGAFGLFMTLSSFAGWGFHPTVLSTLFG